MKPTCELCKRPESGVVYRSEKYRIVMVADSYYPGFCRVIWNLHVKELTDLTGSDRTALMNAVWQVEQAVREVMRPDKINLASFGNMAPHVHWHIIPRYVDDAHFPNPVWGAARRDPMPATLLPRLALLPALNDAILRIAGSK